MLLLQLISVIVQECLIPSHLISNGQHAYLVYSKLSTHGLQAKQQLLRYVEDLLREVSPLALRINQCLLGVLLLLLQHEVVLLQHEQAFFEVFGLGGHREGVRARTCELLFEVGVPMEDLGRGDFGQVHLEEFF